MGLFKGVTNVDKSAQTNARAWLVIGGVIAVIGLGFTIACRLFIIIKLIVYQRNAFVMAGKQSLKKADSSLQHRIILNVRNKKFPFTYRSEREF